MKKQSGFLRRLTALALALCMLAALTSEIFAADILYSGYCGAEGDGSNLTWTLDADWTLTISGSGKMRDYYYTNYPWISDPFAYKTVKKVTIQNGVTSIGNFAFYECRNLASVEMADSVSDIGESSFSFCSGLTSVTIPSSVVSIGEWAFSNSGLTNLTLPSGLDNVGRGVFSGCSSLTSVTIPDTVTSIGASAFGGCNSLASVIIPDAVTSIGASAFTDCSSLTSVIIPDSVTSIGSYVFSRSGITDITIPNSVTSIAYRMFYNCNALTSVAIPTSVTSIGDGAFYGCSNLTSITLPDSITTISYSAFYGCSNLTSVTIPSGVTEVLDGTFTGCSSLTSVTIPESVTKIKARAFSDCSSLTSVAFFGDAPTIGYETFYGCTSSLTLYYIQGKNGWTNSIYYNAFEGTWNGYLLKPWDGKTLPAIAIAVPKDKYCIQVIDETGVLIRDANVTWNTTSEPTDQEGKAFFDLNTAGNPVIYVSKTGYTTWTNKNTNWKKNEKRFERVILYPESYGSLKLQYAKISDLFGLIDVNLVTQTKVLNLRNDGALIGDLNSGLFDLSCEATDTSDVTGYAVYQNTKKIAGSDDGNFQKLDVRDFVEGGGCFVRVTDKAGKTVDTHINLQFAKNSVNEDFKLQLEGHKISFDVIDTIPFVGGHSIEFGLPMDAPVVVSATTDKIQFGINLNLSPDKTESEQVKEYIKTLKEVRRYEKALRKTDLKKLKKFAKEHNKTKFFDDVDFTLCGYAEADFGSKTASGYLMIIVDQKITPFNYNTFVSFIPVTVQISVDISLEAGGMLSYRFDTQTWNGNVFLNPSFGLSPFIGIGCSGLIGGGVYGNGDLDIKWNVFGTNSGLRTVDLTGELGIKGYIGPLEAKKAFAHQTWHLYTANSVTSQSLQSGEEAWDAAPEASAYAPSDLSYLAEESDWAPAAVRTYAARAAQLKASYQTLLGGTYRNAQPVMLSDGSSLYAAFVRADAKTGARYIALTKFDGNSWSEPVRVDASAILDDAPQLCTDGQTLWLAYARTTQEPGNSLVSYAQHQNIVVGTVSKDTLAFTEQKTYQSGNYMRLPTLSCVNGTPVLAWAESAVTDQESVVNPAASTVYTAEFRSGAWPDARKAADTAGVDSFCIGAQNGTAAIAYISDGTLYCGGRVLAENVIGRAVYGRLPSADADSFIWNAGGALHDEAGTIVTAEGMGREFVIVGDSIYFNQSNGASANLAALHYDAVNDHWSAPILLIGDEQYLENLNAASLNGRTYALGMHTTVTISEDEVDDAKDLVWTQILPVSDLKLSDVSFDSDALVPGGTLPITLTVTNSGDHTVSSLALTANGVSTTQVCQLLPGESTEFTVNITCPSEKQTVTFEVQEPGQDDYTPEDNAADCTVGSADAELDLSLLQIGSRKFLQAAVANQGMEPASGSVLFIGPDGQTLAERTFQNLAYGGTVIVEYEPDSFAALYGEDVTATVRLQQDEPNTLNNTDSVPVLLTVTEILSAQRDAAVVTAEIACMQDSGARVICAFYDADGRLLHTVIQPLQSGKNSLSFTISDANAACAKLFVLDAKNAPAAAGKTVQLNS